MLEFSQLKEMIDRKKSIFTKKVIAIILEYQVLGALQYLGPGTSTRYIILEFYNATTRGVQVHCTRTCCTPSTNSLYGDETRNKTVASVRSGRHCPTVTGTSSTVAIQRLLSTVPLVRAYSYFMGKFQ
jgi:hypothetical protein